MTAADWIGAVSAAGSALAAFFAWRAVVASQVATRVAREAAVETTAAVIQDARVARTLELYRFVEERTGASWQFGPEVYSEVMEAARPGGAPSPRATEMLGYLNALEIFALAARSNALDPLTAAAAMENTIRQYADVMDFIRAFRRASGQHTAYLALEDYGKQLHGAQNRSPSTSNATSDRNASS